MTLTTIDWEILMKRFDSLEEKISKLEKEVQEIKPKYKTPTTEDIQKLWDEITNPSYIARKIPCMIESLPPEYKNKPLGLACSCPKCTPYCASLSDTLLQQKASAVELFKDLVPKGEMVEVGVRSCGKLTDCVSTTYLPTPPITISFDKPVDCISNIKVDILATPMQWGCADDMITPEKLLGETE